LALFSSPTPTSLDALLLWGSVVEPAPELVPEAEQLPIAHVVKLDPQGHRLVVGLNVGRGGCDVLARASAVVTGDIVRLEALVGPYADLTAGCEQRFGEISLVLVEVDGGIGSRQIEINNCGPAPLGPGQCGPIDGLTGDDLPLARSGLVGCVPSFWLTDAIHERIEASLEVCDAHSLHRDYLGLLDEWQADS
jgi:hypothetical protein